MTEAQKSPLEIAEDKRAVRKAALADQFNAQRALDLEAIDALEIEHGDSNIAVVDVPFTPGLPTCFAVKCPSSAYVKRYQSRLKPAAQGKTVDAIAAAEEVGAACIVYPDGEDRAALLAARPGVLVGLGNEAIKLASGKAADEGKG